MSVPIQQPPRSSSFSSLQRVLTEPELHATTSPASSLNPDLRRRPRNDRLLSNSSSLASTQTLTEASADDDPLNEQMFDLLPSFEMHNSFKYTSLASPSDEAPPEYEDETSPQREPNIPSTFAAPFLRASPVSSSISQNSSSISINRTNSETSTTMRTLVDEDYQDSIPRNLLDTKDELSQKLNHNIKTQIFITKTAPVPMRPETLEIESMLKEYKPGDIIHGYVTIENTSSLSLDFTAFHVSLEGETSTFDSSTNKRAVKRFLNMVDLSASWFSSFVPTSSGIPLKPFLKDYDNCIIGLPANRILLPMTKYKKLFTFKLPHSSLDTICKHQHGNHTLLPPSLGVKPSKNLNYTNIEIHPELNYGHSGERGDPLMLKDFSRDSVSIDYSINATLLGMKVEPRAPCIISEHAHSIRFIPTAQAAKGPISSLPSGYSSDNMRKSIQDALSSAKAHLQTLDNVDNQTQSSSTSSKHLELRSPHCPAYQRLPPLGDPIFPTTSLRFDKPSEKNGLFKRRSNPPTEGQLTISPVQTSTPKLAYFAPFSTITPEFENSAYCSQLEFKFDFEPTSQSSSPPTIDSIKAGLLITNVYSSSSIPIELRSINGYIDSITNMNKEFQKLYQDYESLANRMQRQNIKITDYIHSELIQDLKTLKDIKVDDYLSYVFDIDYTQPNWISTSNNILRISLKYKNGIKETIVPSFQSCIFSRLYSIHLNIKFKGEKSVKLRIPIDVSHL